MNSPRDTDERLRYWLNANQPERERMCLAVLALDGKYSDIQPRRPEGGPDGGRDIQCRRASQICFGAVGFINSVDDSTQNKTQIKRKFSDDLTAALDAEPMLRDFVFFTNVDLTQGEVDELKALGTQKGVTFVEVYYRERIRITLDSPAGLGFRYNYLSIPLSEPEQAAFFSRFGNELEQLVRGKFETVEKKIDQLEYNIWKMGTIREIELKLKLRQRMRQAQETEEHFRVCLELQNFGQKRSILFGGRDGYTSYNHDKYRFIFGTRTLFWRELAPKDQKIWLGPSGDAGDIPEIKFSRFWPIRSEIFVREFYGTAPFLYVTENLVDKIVSAEFRLDSYIVLKLELSAEKWQKGQSFYAWPEDLTTEEQQIDWRRYDDHFWEAFPETVPPKFDSFST